MLPPLPSAPAESSARMLPVGPGTTRIGWIGAGVMGAAMADRLLEAGYALTIFSRTPAKARPLVEKGA
ncbi:MAG: NAD(P)-binding domain-containing protein, partial [Planctomycetota bacterium]